MVGHPRTPRAAALLGAALVAAALAAAPAAAQDDFSTVEVVATKVAGNVHMLTGAGGNIGVSVGPDGLLIVDDQFAPLADKIRAALKGLGDGKLRFVLNTHWHGDHTGGNAEFGRDAAVVAHKNVRKRLAEGSATPGRTVPPASGAALPVITFDESLSIHFNGEEIEVIHFPAGHTDGDSIIFFTRSNVVHMGDQLFNRRFPFIDLASGGSVEGYLKNLESALKRIPDDARVIPGHGALATSDDVRLAARMLRETAAAVARGVAAGKSLAELQKAGVGDEWKSWGWDFISADRWIEMLYHSATKGAPK